MDIHKCRSARALQSQWDVGGGEGVGSVNTHIPLKEAPKKDNVIGMAVSHLTNAANTEVEG